MLETLHLILKSQFLTLPFRDLQVVRGWPRQLFFDFSIQGTMLFGQLLKACV
jgi:hypothetical protein